MQGILKARKMEEIVVREIDPLLSLRRKLVPSTVLVFEVEKEGSVYVLKTSSSCFQWGVEHIKREAEILELAKDIEGITHLVRRYPDSDDYESSILKEFFYGRSLALFHEKVKSSVAQARLEKAVCGLHSLGVMDLDIGPKNIVLSETEDDARIIDLGYGQIYKPDEIAKSAIDMMKLGDLRKLERLFG